jgi:ankyrin repeat protein
MDKRQFHNLHEIVLGLSDAPLDQEFRRAPGLIDAVDANGRTPLSWAAFCGREDYVLSLLCKEAKPDLTDHRGRTALHYAAIAGETQCVEIPLSHGADPNLKDQNGMSALAYAVSGRQSEESVNILLREHADANARDSDNTSILQLASMSSSATVIDDLLQHGSELNHVDDLGQNAATMAVCRNNNTVLSVLLQRGISLDVVTEKGETIMHFAATRATVGTMKTLSTASPENRLGDIDLNLGTESQISVNPQCTFDSRLKERRPIDEECLPQLTQAWTELYEVFERQRASLHPKQKIL